MTTERENFSRNPSRRAIFGCAPVAVLAGTAMTPALPQTVNADPIFGLIAKYEAAEKVWTDLEAHLVWSDPESKREAAHRAHVAARRHFNLLISTPPQTADGVMAYCRWMARYFEGSIVEHDAAQNLLNSPLVADI